MIYPHSNIKEYHHNALYLVVALSMIFMTLVLAIQPLYLLNALGLPRENAGFVNANIQVITEIVDLLFVGYLGFLSDRFGRIPVMYYGFLVSAISALISAFSLELGILMGGGGLLIFYVTRAIMSLGSTAVWPQLATLTGDYTDIHSRPRLLAKVAFMTAFGATLVYAILMQLPKHTGLIPVMLLPVLVAFVGAWLTRHFLVETSKQLNKNDFPMQQIIHLLKQEKSLRLSFLAAFSSRNDMVIIGLFLMTWFIYFSDLLPGVTHAQAAAQAGIIIGFIGLTVLASIPIWGYIIEFYGRIPALVLGLCLSGTGFVAMGLILNPLSYWTFLPAFLVGIGQAGCLLAPQTLTLDVAPEAIRGSVMGAFNTIGSIGIIFFLQAGGLLFDWLSPTAPFIFTGIANFIIMVYGLTVFDSEKKINSK
ncbi:MAG: MFS transporter [Magnetococcus sp. DMHC-6]